MINKYQVITYMVGKGVSSLNIGQIITLVLPWDSFLTE